MLTSINYLRQHITILTRPCFPLHSASRCEERSSVVTEMWSPKKTDLQDCPVQVKKTKSSQTWCRITPVTSNGQQTHVLTSGFVQVPFVTGLSFHRKLPTQLDCLCELHTQIQQDHGPKCVVAAQAWEVD